MFKCCCLSGYFSFVIVKLKVLRIFMQILHCRFLKSTINRHFFKAKFFTLNLPYWIQTVKLNLFIDDNYVLFRFNVDSKAKVGLVRLGAIGERLGRCNLCLVIYPIITQEPLDRFASNFDWGTRKNHGNVFSLLRV